MRSYTSVYIATASNIVVAMQLVTYLGHANLWDSLALRARVWLYARLSMGMLPAGMHLAMYVATCYCNVILQQLITSGYTDDSCHFQHLDPRCPGKV